MLPGTRAWTGKAKGETVGVSFILGGGAWYHRCRAAAEYGAFSGSGVPVATRVGRAEPLGSMPASVGSRRTSPRSLSVEEAALSPDGGRLGIRGGPTRRRISVPNGRKD